MAPGSSPAARCSALQTPSPWAGAKPGVGACPSSNASPAALQPPRHAWHCSLWPRCSAPGASARPCPAHACPDPPGHEHGVPGWVRAYPRGSPDTWVRSPVLEGSGFGEGAGLGAQCVGSLWLWGGVGVTLTLPQIHKACLTFPYGNMRGRPPCPSLVTEGGRQQTTAGWGVPWRATGCTWSPCPHSSPAPCLSALFGAC